MKIIILFLILLTSGNSWANNQTNEFPSAEEELKAYFFAAARNNDVVLLKTFVEAGFPVDVTNSKGYTALMVATYHGYTEAFDYLGMVT